MPDHLHLILQGQTDTSDLLKGMTSFKQQTDYWLAQHRPAICWQKDFYDHLIRTEENLEVQVMYVLNNPVRAGVVTNWTEYPYSGGSIAEKFRRGVTSK